MFTKGPFKSQCWVCPFLATIENTTDSMEQDSVDIDGTISGNKNILILSFGGLYTNENIIQDP